MQSSEQNVIQSTLEVYNPIVTCLKSPIPSSLENGIDTPQKLPSAPHPSPINMVAEYNNPKSKETFRTELLKACLLKLPEVVEDKKIFDEYLCEKLTSESEVLIPNESRPGLCLPRYKKVKFDEVYPQSITSLGDRNSKHCHQEILENNDVFGEADLVNIDQRKGVDLDVFAGVEESQDKTHNVIEKVINKEGSVETIATGQISSKTTYFNFSGEQEDSNLRNAVNISKAKQSYLNVEDLDTECIPKESISKYINDQPVYFDHRINYQDISRLLCVAAEYADCPSRGRSPCSDNLSTIALCASDASDMSDEDSASRDESMDFGRSLNHTRKKISDEDFGDESADSRGFERSVDQPSKKKPKSALRRFLNWRRCLKIRKRAASLDESRFPFLVNSIDSYKTEFELSV